MDTCTSLVAQLVNENYDVKSRYHPTAGLAIVPTSRGLVFYTQIQRASPVHGDARLNMTTDAFVLMRVSQEKQVDILHEEFVTDRHRKYIIQGLGQVAVREQVLCWTALDRVICAQIDDRASISHARSVANADGVRAVCTSGNDIAFV